MTWSCSTHRSRSWSCFQAGIQTSRAQPLQAPLGVHEDRREIAGTSAEASGQRPFPHSTPGYRQSPKHCALAWNHRMGLCFSSCRIVTFRMGPADQSGLCQTDLKQICLTALARRRHQEDEVAESQNGFAYLGDFINRIECLFSPSPR